MSDMSESQTSQRKYLPGTNQQGAIAILWKTLQLGNLFLDPDSSSNPKPNHKSYKNFRGFIILLLSLPIFQPNFPLLPSPQPSPPTRTISFGKPSLMSDISGSDACGNNQRNIIHPHLTDTWFEWLQIRSSGVKF